MKSWVLALMLLTAPWALANVAAQGPCSTGGQYVITSGLSSSGTFLASYPQCLVTVYPTGSSTPVPANQIYSDNHGTVLGNPFTASTVGWWQFYAATARYDVVLSGGGLAAPVTISDISLFDPAAAVLTSPTLTNPTSTGIDAGVETLTNKTLTVATLTAPTITNPTTTGTDSGVETLANKTLTSPTINTPTIAGGTINSTPIGATTPAAVAATTLKVGGSQALTSVQGLTGTKLLAATGTFTAGNIVTTDANGNAKDSGYPDTVNSILNGTGAPSNTLGNNGDFYLRTDTTCLYGPKAAGAWPGTCVSLVSGVPLFGNGTEIVTTSTPSPPAMTTPVAMDVGGKLVVYTPSTANNCLLSDVVVAVPGTYVSGPNITLGAGTWNIFFDLTFYDASNDPQVSCILWDGTNVARTGETKVLHTNATTMSRSARRVIPSSATWRADCTASNATTHIVTTIPHYAMAGLVPLTNTASCIWAEQK